MNQRLSVKRYAPNLFKCVLWKQNTQRLQIPGRRKTALAVDPVSLPSETLHSEVAPEEKRKPRTSFSRAKSAIFEYSACNPWQYMITVTVSPEKFDRLDLDDIMRHYAQWTRNYRRLKPGWEDFKYILVPEKHEDGEGWHLHGFIMGVPEDHVFPRFAYELIDPTKDEQSRKRYWKYFYLDKDDYRNFPDIEDRFGWVTVKKLDGNYIRTAGYITKYITKDFFTTPEAFGASLYYSCRGLNRPDKIFYGDVLQALVPDIDLRDMFFDRLFNYANDYIRAGFCTGLTIQPNRQGVLGLYAWIHEEEFPVKLFDLVSAQKLNYDFITHFPGTDYFYTTS